MHGRRFNDRPLKRKIDTTAFSMTRFRRTAVRSGPTGQRGDGRHDRTRGAPREVKQKSALPRGVCLDFSVHIGATQEVAERRRRVEGGAVELFVHEDQHDGGVGLAADVGRGQADEINALGEIDRVHRVQRPQESVGDREGTVCELRPRSAADGRVFQGIALECPVGIVGTAKDLNPAATHTSPRRPGGWLSDGRDGRAGVPFAGIHDGQRGSQAQVAACRIVVV